MTASDSGEFEERKDNPCRSPVVPPFPPPRPFASTGPGERIRPSPPGSSWSRASRPTLHWPPWRSPELRPQISGVPLTVVVSALLLALLVGLTVLSRERGAIQRLAERILVWLKRLVGRPKGDPGTLVSDAVRQIGTIHASRADLALVAAAALLNWGSDLLCLVASFRALHAHPPWPGIVVAYTFGQMASSIPFLPGGLGLVEGSLAATLVASERLARSPWQPS